MQYKEEGHRQYFLYGCVRTDNVMPAKTKKLGSQGFWLSSTKMGARDNTRCTTRANRCSNDQKTKKSEDVNGGGVKYQMAGVAHVVDLLVLWIVLFKFDEGVANLDMVVLV